MTVGVLTSGGDAPGMNAAVRAVVRSCLTLGVDCVAVHEGYAGLVDGGDQLRPASWTDVSHVLPLGGTVLGTARSQAFRQPEGRRRAVANLVQRGVDRLVVIGGDGSLTGALRLREEWSSHLLDLVAAGELPAALAQQHPQLAVVGLAGSIDNDLWGTDRTIGCDSALHRIVEAVDTLTSTARSHQRSFVVEVMGRRCGFLALAAGVCTGADHVLLPERPSPAWREQVCAALARGRAQGRRKSIVLLAEGARDADGVAIRAEEVRDVVAGELGIETRITVLGHVQRGGTPSAYDRLQSTALGAAAVERVLAAGPADPPLFLGTAGGAVRARPLDEVVRKTHAVAEALEAGRYQAAVNARGTEFLQLLGARVPGTPAAGASGRRLLLAHVGAPAPGMNAAVRSVVRLANAGGHTCLVADGGLGGVLQGRVRALLPADVHGIAARGSTVLGTSRWRPRSADEVAALGAALGTHGVDGVILVGGFGALRAATAMPVAVPVAVVPATISNNVPGTDASLGADTAVNAICEAVDRLKLSAIGSGNRVFFVEVMGRRCGYLARAAGVAAGAELVYTDDEAPITLAGLQRDVDRLNRAMDAGRDVAIVLVADGVPRAFEAPRLADLFAQLGGGRFDTRVCVLGHLQQGGRPSPADRLLATRLAAAGVAAVSTGGGRVLIGLRDGEVVSTPIEQALAAADLAARRPRHVRPLGPRFGLDSAPFDRK